MALKVWNGSSDAYWDTAANWTPTGVPAADDDVVITGANDLKGKAAGSEDTAITNQCGDFAVVNYTGQIGSPGAPLTFDDTDGFKDNAQVLLASDGRVYIALGEGATTGAATAPAVIVQKTANALDGEDYGVYIDALNLKSLTITGGSVALGAWPGDALVVTNVYVREGEDQPRVLLGPGATMTNTYVEAGFVRIDADDTLAVLDISGGVVRKDCTQTVTSLRVRNAGLFIWNGGTLTDLDLYADGVVDSLQSDVARTLTAGTLYGGEYRRHPSAITHTAEPVIPAGSTVRIA